MPYHHYVSAFHLAQFTTAPHLGRNAKIYVLDLPKRALYRTAVKRAGGEGGYNAAQGIPGLGTEEMEALFERRYETPAAPVLRAVNETHRMPRPRDLAVLLDYFAFLSVNNPSRRGAMNDAQQQMLFYMAQMMVAHPETFEAVQVEYRRDGVPLLGDIPLDELRTTLENGTFRYDMPTTAHLRGMGQIVDALRRLLGQRVWSLLIASADAPDFVCGDHPVVLTWTVERSRAMVARGAEWPATVPGFAMDDTEVVVPLGRRVSIVGTYGGTARRLVADAQNVSGVNRRMLDTATAYVYSAESTFLFWEPPSALQDSSVLIDTGLTRPARGA